MIIDTQVFPPVQAVKSLGNPLLKLVALFAGILRQLIK
jgi:hypothetical protein